MDISKLDMEEISMAMEDHSFMTTYYLDKETGKVMPIMGDTLVDEEDPMLAEIEENPSRYLFIEPMPSRDSFSFMEQFVESLPDSEDKRILERALEWRKPFSNFKNALHDMPEIRERWFAYKKECMNSYILEWFEAEDSESP
ncbi:MAG: hypothetical protein BWY09_01168 [Candidatus Hydrogenedentes bacterium ADurb.Bin179]|nr:MAG: hypothetical protein BWY09_01168 [Candidatus Hydrogenedentes bacterium ADurb.Bin179]